MSDTRPLFQIDAAWLYVVAGLVICASGIIVPAQKDLQSLRDQYHDLKQDETVVFARLEAHASFLDQLDLNDPSLLKRLAAAQLNMVPKSDTPVLVNASGKATIIDWIDAAVADKQVEPPGGNPIAESLLTRLSTGPLRLWFLGGGVLCVFIGIILTPGLAVRKAADSLVADERDDVVDADSETDGQWTIDAKEGAPERIRTALAPSRVQVADALEPHRPTAALRHHFDDDVPESPSSKISAIAGQAHDDAHANDAITIEERAILLDSQDDAADDEPETVDDSLFDDEGPVNSTQEASSTKSVVEVVFESGSPEPDPQRATTTDTEEPVPVLSHTQPRVNEHVEPAERPASEHKADSDTIALSQDGEEIEAESLTESDFEYVYLDEAGRELTAEEVEALDDEEFEWVEVDDESDTGGEPSTEIVVKRGSDRSRHR